MDNMDFNLAEDVVKDPLLHPGDYFGSIVKVVAVNDKNKIDWTVCLNDNPDIMCDDGTTPVDGIHLYYTNWMPSEADKSIPAASGKGTKYDVKLKMFAQFCKRMRLSVNTGADLKEALENQEWVGLDVKATVGLREYLGNVSNEIKWMNAADEEENPF